MKIAEHCFLITGAASGLGAATADRLVAAGGRVVLADISEAAREHAAALGASARFCHCDITDSASVSAALDVAEQSFGALHGVIHCAGVVSVAKLVDREGEPAPLEGFEKTLAINLSGTFNVARLAAARMARNVAEGKTESAASFSIPLRSRPSMVR